MSLFQRDAERNRHSTMIVASTTATSNLPGMDEVDLLAPLRCTECDVTVDSKQHQNNTRQKRSTGGESRHLGSHSHTDSNTFFP